MREDALQFRISGSPAVKMSPLDGEFVMAPSIIQEVSNPGDPITDMYWFSSPARLGAVPGDHFWMSFRPE